MSSDSQSHCPSDEELRALAEGRLDDATTTSCEEHLTSCARCQDRLETLSDFGSVFVADNSSNSSHSDAHKTQILGELIEHLSTASHISPVVTRAGGSLDFLEPPGDPAHLGRLGPYEVLEEVARGGGGIVLKAHDTELERIVAIKVLDPELASSTTSREHFLREARAAAKLEHDNVMPIYSVDQKGPIPYIVVPFVDGPNLQQRLDVGGPLDVGEATRIAYDICAALEAAHTRGMVHRDVKPANIMLLEDRERVWLADFGLARAADDRGGKQKGLIAGTPSFMAPEQAKCEAVDHRADLFSLGCVIYAMISGASPFHGDSVRASIEKIVNEEPPPLQDARSDLPDWLGHLVASLLSKDPSERPGSAAEVREILSQHLPGKRGLALSTKIVLAVCAVSAIAAALVVTLNPASSPVEEAGFIVSREPDVLHSALVEAIAAARSGDTILVRGSGELNVGLTSIREKALTVRAEPGSQPVFVANSVRTTILQTDAPLCVEGIAFKHPDSESPIGALPHLRSRGAPLFLANCRFERPTATELIAPTRLPPVIEVRDGSRIEIVNCEFRTGVGRNIVVSQSERDFHHHASLVNNLIVGQVGMFLEASAQGRHDWELERNTVVGAVSIFVRSSREGLPEGRVVANSNVFEFGNSLLILGNPKQPLEFDAFELSGSENLFRRMDGAGGNTRYIARRWGRSGTAIESFEAFAATMGVVGREVSAPLFEATSDSEDKPHESLDGPSERFQLRAEYAEAAEAKGCDVSKLGPGEKFDAWRMSEAYAAWSERVRNGMER